MNWNTCIKAPRNHATVENIFPQVGITCWESKMIFHFLFAWLHDFVSWCFLIVSRKWIWRVKLWTDAVRGETGQGETAMWSRWNRHETNMHMGGKIRAIRVIIAKRGCTWLYQSIPTNLYQPIYTNLLYQSGRTKLVYQSIPKLYQSGRTKLVYQSIPKLYQTGCTKLVYESR